MLWRCTVRVKMACKGPHGRNCGQHGARMTGPLWAFLSLAMGASDHAGDSAARLNSVAAGVPATMSAWKGVSLRDRGQTVGGAFTPPGRPVKRSIVRALHGLSGLCFALSEEGKA